jgi:mannose-P-dolichol utilization defect 1
MTQVAALVRDALPPVCARPETLLDVPSVLLGDAACLKATVSLVLGVGIVCMAAMIKLPQIAAVVAAESGDGLATSTLLIETFGYSYNLAAHYRMRYPLSTYGDFGVLILQNSILIALVYRFSGRASTGGAAVAALFCGLALMCSPAFPVSVLKLMTLGNVPVTIAARLPQILKSSRDKSTGRLSAVTCCGLFLGSSARVFTTLQDVDDVNILVGYITSASLNAVIASQVLYYGNKTAKDDKALAQKKRS